MWLPATRAGTPLDDLLSVVDSNHVPHQTSATEPESNRPDRLRDRPAKPLLLPLLLLLRLALDRIRDSYSLLYGLVSFANFPAHVLLEGFLARRIHQWHGGFPQLVVVAGADLGLLVSSPLKGPFNVASA